MECAERMPFVSSSSHFILLGANGEETPRLDVPFVETTQSLQREYIGKNESGSQFSLFFEYSKN
jgi:hypothetical protein